MIDKLKEFIEKKGIMLTVRYVMEQNTWYVVLHIEKTKAVHGVAGTFDKAAQDALSEAEKILLT